MSDLMQSTPPHRGSEPLRSARRMPAPLLLPASGLIAGIVISAHFDPLSPMVRWVFPAMSGLLAVIVWATSRTAAGAISRIAILIAAAALGFWRHQVAIDIAADHIMRAAGPERMLTRLAGDVVRAPTVRPATRYNPYLPVDPPTQTSFVLAARELRGGENPLRVSGLVQVRIDNPGDASALGDQVVLTGWLYRPTGPRNPYQLDWAAMQRRNGIFAAMICDGSEFVQVESAAAGGWYGWQGRLRAAGRSLLLDSDAGSDDAPANLLEAILLGQRSSVSARMDDAFARTGAVHVLSVSGFHIGVLAGACWFVLHYLLRRGNRASLIGMLGCVLLYAFLAEPTAPVLRSVIMTAGVAAAFLLNRPAALMNSVCLACIVSLMIRPMDVFTAGFQLSFAQVLALIYIVPGYYRRFTAQPADEGDEFALRDVHSSTALAGRILWRGLVGLGLTSGICWLVAAPLVAFHFQMAAPWAALQSMLLTPLFSIEIVLGMVTMGISAVAPGAADVVQALLHGSASWLLALVDWFAGWPGTKIAMAPQSAALPLMAYLGLAVAITWRRRCIDTGAAGMQTAQIRDLAVLALICLAPLFISTWRWSDFSRDESSTLTILSVGNGSAAALVLPERRAVVLDLGASSNLDVGAAAARILQHHGISRVEAALVSHDDLDHFSGLPALWSAMSIDRVLINRHFRAAARHEPPARDFLERCASRGVAIEEIAAPRALTVGAGRLDVLWPPANRPETAHGNDSSLVMMLRLGDKRILFPGDIEQEALAALVKLHAANEVRLDCDVLIAPHHGAVVGDATAAFFRAASPRIVVVSSGRDRAALAESVCKTLPDCRMLNTRDVGAVVVTISAAGELTISTPCNWLEK